VPSILSYIVQPVLVVDHHGLIKFANPPALAALGYEDGSDLRGEPSQKDHRDRPDRTAFAVEEPPISLSRADETVHAEDWFVRRDGSRIPVEYWSAPIGMAGGVGAVVTFSDINLRRQNELAVRERDAILSALGQPVWVVTDTGLISYVNQAAVTALGFDDASELVGQNGHWLVHYKHRDGSRFPIEDCPLTRVRQTGEPLQFAEDWWVRKDGSMIPLAYTAVPVQTAEGYGTVVNFTDMTTRLAMEQAARERDVAQARAAELAVNEARQHAVLEAALDGVIIMDRSGCITYINTATEQIFGYPRNELIGRELAEAIVPPSLREAHRRGLAHYLTTGDTRTLNRRIEIVGMRADGTEFPAELTVTRTGPPAAAAFTGYIRVATLELRGGALCAAITSRWRAEQELRASRVRLVTAFDAARQRVTRDLHDGAQQWFVSTIINLQLAQHKWNAEPQRARELVGRALHDAQQGLNDLREIASGIHPRILTHRGLGAALADLAGRFPVPVHLDPPKVRLPASIEATTYFFCSEALTNVVKHASASSAWVRVDVDDVQCTVQVRDNGTGGVRARSDTSGLSGLRDRIGALNGSMEIVHPPEGGTVLQASIPLRQHWAGGGSQLP
jgi:PAS domain S-box-containing protein